MNMVKIVHASDLHLDCRFANFSLEKSKIRRQELKLSFENVFNSCTDADIFLICGDLFDNTSFLKGTVDFLINLFKKYSGTIFFICGGNHDNYNSPAMQAIVDAKPENVVVFSGKAEYMELDDIKVRVYGMSFSDKTHYSSMINDFKVIDDEYINILMLHGEIASGNGDCKYNPISLEQIENSGFDYVALGHTHDFSGVKKLGRTHFAYCGTHEGHGFDECGEKGVIYGTVGKEYCDLKFVRTCLREYKIIETDVSELNTIEQIINTIKPGMEYNNIYKVVLKGTLSENIVIDCEVLESQLSSFYVKVVDETRRSYNLDEIARLQNFKGYIAKTVLKELEVSEEEDVDTVFAASDFLFELLENGGVK